jgi:hypothetical protein
MVMKDLLDKISSYNIFNYLLPGIIFVVFSKEAVGYNFIQENNLLGAFLYYFIGMVVSRFGSVIIEPILKKISFLKFKEYKFYVLASKQDTKLELLSEVNNTYRTISSLFILLFLFKAYKFFEIRYSLSEAFTLIIVASLILLLFLFSYRKQTNYIAKRIDTNTGTSNS